MSELPIKLKTFDSPPKSLVINAFGGAGAGKTTACLMLVAELKKKGFQAEYVNEYAKELVWEKNWDMLDGSEEKQRLILQEQVKRLERLYGEVDFIVTDAPILLNTVYSKDLTPEYETLVSNLYNRYQNFNFFVERDKANFEVEGRIHSLEESIEKDNQIKDILKSKGLFYGSYNHSTILKVVPNAVKSFNRLQERVNQMAKKKYQFDPVAQKEKLDGVLKNLEDGLKDMWHSDKYREFLKSMGKFHRYSINNIALIYRQMPDFTHVASYTTWQRLGRHVLKGQKGIQILQPSPYKVSVDVEVKDANGKITTETVEKQRMSYKVANVFDISQTDGRPFPSLTERLQGNSNKFDILLDAVEKATPLDVRFMPIPGGVNGYFSYLDPHIGINDAISKEQQVKTLIHEIAHSELHADENYNKIEGLTKQTKELEAESVAYVVCDHFGIDSSQYTFGYIKGWAGDQDIKILKESLERVRDKAGDIIVQVEKQLELALEKDLRLKIEIVNSNTDGLVKGDILTLNEFYEAIGIYNSANPLPENFTPAIQGNVLIPNGFNKLTVPFALKLQDQAITKLENIVLETTGQTISHYQGLYEAIQADFQFYEVKDSTLSHLPDGIYSSESLNIALIEQGYSEKGFEGGRGTVDVYTRNSNGVYSPTQYHTIDLSKPFSEQHQALNLGEQYSNYFKNIIKSSVLGKMNLNNVAPQKLKILANAIDENTTTVSDVIKTLKYQAQINDEVVSLLDQDRNRSFSSPASGGPSVEFYSKMLLDHQSYDYNIQEALSLIDNHLASQQIEMEM